MSNVINPKLGIFQKTPRVPLASLPSAALFQAITRYEISDYGGNVAVAVNGQWRFELPFRTTWAGRPAVGLVPIGTELQVTDYANHKFISDGTYWRPAQGRAMLLSKWGTTSAPLAVLTGAVDSQFTLTAADKTIKAGMLIPGCKLNAQMWVVRNGTAGTAYAYAKIGTSDSYSDGSFAGVSMGVTEGLSLRMDVLATIVSSQLFTMSTIAPGASGTTASSSSGNVNVASDMFFSAHIRAANTADTFKLVGYQLVMEA